MKLLTVKSAIKNSQVSEGTFHHIQEVSVALEDFLCMLHCAEKMKRDLHFIPSPFDQHLMEAHPMLLKKMCLT